MQTILNSSPAEAVPETLVPARDCPTEKDALPQVLREIAADCGVEPEKYLEEVRVPVGGE